MILGFLHDHDMAMSSLVLREEMERRAQLLRPHRFPGYSGAALGLLQLVYSSIDASKTHLTARVILALEI